MEKLRFSFVKIDAESYTCTTAFYLEFFQENQIQFLIITEIM